MIPNINDYELLSLYFSAKCQLNCSYCYVAKNSNKMAEIHKQIRDSLINGTYIQILKDKTKLYKDQIKTIGLWGAEPYLNLDLFDCIIKELIDWFPNFCQIQMSTNMIGNPNLYLKMFKSIDLLLKEKNRKFNIDMQFSIDGPEWITDNNRGRGTTKKLLNNVKELLSNLNNFSDNLSFYFHSKTTLNLDNIKEMAEDKNKTFKFFKFFDDWTKETKEIFESPHISFCFDPLPTFAAPIEASVEDGKILKKWYSLIAELNDLDFPNLKKPFLNQLLSFNLKSFINGNIHFNIGNCGAGFGAISFTPFNDFAVCHHLFHHYYEDTNSTIVKLLSSFSVKKDKDKDWYRFHYINRLNSDFIQLKWIFHKGLMYLLAEAEQIDKKWIKDEQLLKLSFVTILSMSCKTLAATNYGSQWLSDVGAYRLFFNGAIDELIKYYRSTGWWEKIT